MKRKCLNIANRFCLRGCSTGTNHETDSTTLRSVENSGIGEFNIFIFIMICIQKRRRLNPGPATDLQPAPQPQAQPGPRRGRKPPNPWVMPWILERQEKGRYSNLLANVIHTDIQGYQNFVRMPPAFFDLIKECIHHCIKKSVTNFSKPLEVELKLAIMVRHLATGETVTFTTTKTLLPGAANPERCRIQIPVDRSWVKWIFIRCTDFQQTWFEGED